MGVGAMKAKWEEIKSKDAVFLDLWEDDPEVVTRTLIRRGKSFASIGLKEAQVNAAMASGLLSREQYDAVMAASAATQEPAQEVPAEPEPVNA
jgi:hypothetical protein